MLSKNPKFNISWQDFFAFAMFAMFLLELFGLIAPLRRTDLYNTYGIVALSACAGIYFYKKGFSGPWEIKLFIAYLGWVLITRWLNKDFYLLVDFDHVLMVLFSFLLFAVGTLLNAKQREILLDVLSFVYGGFFVLMSAAGIFVAVTNTYIHLPPEEVWITVKGNSSLYSLNLLSSPTAIGAGRVFLAWTLFLYQFIKRKHPFAKALSLAAIIILHITIPLFHNRNLQLGLSMSYGMLALLFAIRYLKNKSIFCKTLALPIVTTAAVVTCFLSFNWSNIMVSKVYDFSAPRFEAFYNSCENKLDSEYFGIVLTPEELAELGELRINSSQSDFSVKPLRAFVPTARVTPTLLSSKGNMTDSRNILENVTLTGRTSVWQSGIMALKEKPLIALRGSLTNVFMDIINDIRHELINTTRATHHMHNMFMQVLMITGIPGLLLIILWTVLMVKNVFKVYFSEFKGICFATKALTIPLAGIFVFNLTEVVIFGMLDMIGICFFLIAGIFVGYYYDYFPTKKNH